MTTALQKVLIHHTVVDKLTSNLILIRDRDGNFGLFSVRNQAVVANAEFISVGFVDDAPLLRMMHCNEKHGLFSTRDHVFVLQPDFDHVDEMVRDYSVFPNLLLERSGKWGIFSVQTEQPLTQFEFDSIEYMGTDDLWGICAEGQWGIFCAQKQKVLVSPKFSTISCLNGSTFRVRNGGGKIGVLCTETESIVWE